MVKKEEIDWSKYTSNHPIDNRDGLPVAEWIRRERDNDRDVWEDIEREHKASHLKNPQGRINDA